MHVRARGDEQPEPARGDRPAADHDDAAAAQIESDEIMRLGYLVLGGV
ncbi:Uncharacterised protein [Mycobacteroides abscessus subsp. abscessus]|nr:Uncharacterised protein [Mycobacteroides abscessus subsp. abscessus]